MGILKNFSIIGLVLILSGCGFIHKIWGEGGPARSSVILPPGDPLPSFTMAFDDDDARAENTLKQWHDNIISSFNKIEGRKTGFISAAEIRTLILKGMVKIDADPNITVKHVFAIMELLGFKDGVEISNIESIFDWLEKNRKQVRTFQHLFLSDGAPAYTSRDIITVINLFGSFVELTGDQSISPAHLYDLVIPFFPNNLPHLKKGLKPGITLTVSFFSSFCGDRVENQNWNGKRIGTCIHELTNEFSDYIPVFEFIFGNVNPTKDRINLEALANTLPHQIDQWIRDHHHPIFKIQTVADFTDALEIPPPYAFFKLTEWLPKLNSDSSEAGFSPTFFIDIARIIQHWTVATLDATPHEVCNSKNWKDCEFKSTYEPIEKLYDGEYATLIRKKTLGFVSKIALYQTLSNFMMEKLDTKHDGYLDESIKDLINITIRLIDTNAFAQNVINRLLEKPIDPTNTEDSLKTVQRQGLSELAAFASDIIPARDTDHLTFLQKIEAQFYNPAKPVSYSLDPIGITAFLYVYDLISSMRDDILANYPIPVRTDGVLAFVKRKDFVAAIPSILADHFPGIYKACLDEGFERTCGVVFTQILANAEVSTGEIETYEMDLISLSAILLESMMNRCDQDGNGLLTNRLFSGNDEKKCMLTVASALAQRLMHSGIIETDEHAETLMSLIKRVAPVRWAAKIALTRGTTHALLFWALPPMDMLTGPATLGSVMALGAELMASDKVKAIDDHVVGPIDSAGDELIYQSQLTSLYTPKVRTSTPRKRPDF